MSTMGTMQSSGRGGRSDRGGGRGRGRGRGRGSDRGSNKFTPPDNFLLENPEYLRQHNELQKEARTWNSQGEYWLGRDAAGRAECLLKGNVAESKVMSGPGQDRASLDGARFSGFSRPHLDNSAVNEAVPETDALEKDESEWMRFFTDSKDKKWTEAGDWKH